MTQRQAAWTSVGEFLQRREGYDKKRQQEWEMSRWVAYSIFSPFLGKNRPRTPMQWVKFPWETNKRPSAVIKINESQIKALNDIFNDFNKK
jgi:hypothetical protein